MPQDFKSFTQIRDVVGIFFALYQHIIHVNLHWLPNFFSEHLSYKSLVGCPSIFQPKWHYFIIVESHCWNQICAFLVRPEERNLVITGISINETHYFMAGCWVHQPIYLRQLAIIQICKVYTYPQLAILLTDDHWVWDPFWELSSLIAPTLSNLWTSFSIALTFFGAD